MVDWIQSTNLLNENCMIVKSTEIMDASSDFTHKKNKNKTLMLTFFRALYKEGLSNFA